MGDERHRGRRRAGDDRARPAPAQHGGDARAGPRDGGPGRRSTGRRRRPPTRPDPGEHPMQIPKPTPADIERFRSAVPDDPRVEVKPMFGNLGAFVNGNMFMGLFGADIGVKLAPGDAADAARRRGRGTVRTRRAADGRVRDPAALRSSGRRKAIDGRRPRWGTSLPCRRRRPRGSGGADGPVMSKTGPSVRCEGSRASCRATADPSQRGPADARHHLREVHP